jgi:hypothetical protein
VAVELFDDVEQTQPVSFDEATTSNVNYEHRDPQLWASICNFFGCDPLDKSPNSGAYFRGWNKKNFILAYQLFSTGWVLQRLLSGEPAVFVAHDMGLGKTAIVVAEIWIMILLIEDSKKAIDVETFQNSGYFDARTLMDKGATYRPRIETGPTLILAMHRLHNAWVTNIRKFVGKTNIQIVLAGPQLTRAEKDFYCTQNRCLMMLDEIAPGSRWYPSQAQLESRYTKKGLQIPRPFLVTHLLERNLVLNPDWPRKRDDETPKEAQAREATREEMLEDNLKYVYDGPPPWFNGCSNFVLFTTPRTIPRNIWLENSGEYNSRSNRLVRNKQNVLVYEQKYPINTSWRRVIVDEFHEHVDKWGKVWLTLASVAGYPQFIHLSRTPFNKVKSLVGSTLAPELQYWQADY